MCVPGNLPNFKKPLLDFQPLSKGNKGHLSFLQVIYISSLNLQTLINWTTVLFLIDKYCVTGLLKYLNSNIFDFASKSRSKCKFNPWEEMRPTNFSGSL